MTRDESKVLVGEPAREVLELLHGERAVVRLVARLAGEVAGAPILALREVDDAHGKPTPGPSTPRT